MSCNRTEYRLLLHAHDALGWWERWHLERHLRGCPGCREQLGHYAEERSALAACLSAEPRRGVADRVALELGVYPPTTGPRMVLSRRLPFIVATLAGLLAAGAALAFVQWREASAAAQITDYEMMQLISRPTCAPDGTPLTGTPEGKKWSPNLVPPHHAMPTRQ